MCPFPPPSICPYTKMTGLNTSPSPLTTSCNCKPLFVSYHGMKHAKTKTFKHDRVCVGNPGPGLGLPWALVGTGAGLVPVS